MPVSRAATIALLSLLLAACNPFARKDAAPPSRLPAPATPSPTPLRFTLAASPNDTWNAVGQVLVRTPGVSYDGRSQMLGLYAIRYRGEALMMLTRGVPASDTVTTLTTEVSVVSPQGKAMASAGAAELLAMLARELPAEIGSVKAQFEARKRAKAKKPARRKASRK